MKLAFLGTSEFAVPALKAHRDEIAGRAMLCRRGTVFPIE
mgnify:CR=1 FL=1